MGKIFKLGKIFKIRKIVICIRRETRCTKILKTSLNFAVKFLHLLKHSSNTFVTNKEVEDRRG